MKRYANAHWDRCIIPCKICRKVFASHGRSTVRTGKSAVPSGYLKKESAMFTSARWFAMLTVRVQKHLAVFIGALAFSAGAALGSSVSYTQTNIVSDGATPAAVTDPNLKNPWGLAFNPAGPIWIANNHTGVATI